MLNSMLQFEEKIRNLDYGNTFFDTANFSWVQEVEAYWPSIRQELERLLNGIEHLPGFEKIHVEQKELSDDKR